MKHPAEMLLKLLINGEVIEHEGETYAMDVDGSLCLVYNISSDEETAYKIDCDLSSFIKMAEKIGRDELWLKLCALQLRGIK